MLERSVQHQEEAEEKQVGHEREIEGWRWKGELVSDAEGLSVIFLKWSYYILKVVESEGFET